MARWRCAAEGGRRAARGFRSRGRWGQPGGRRACGFVWIVWIRRDSSGFVGGCRSPDMGRPPPGGERGPSGRLAPGGGSQARFWTAEDQISTSCTRIATECNRVRPSDATADAQPPDRPNAAWPARVSLLSPVMTHTPTCANGHMTGTAAFFDLDKTIIARSSSLAFSRPFYASGLINRRTVLRSAYAQFVYLVGGADHDQMERMREYLQSMVAGWPVAQVREVVAETLHELIDPIVYDEAVTLIEEHRDAGRDIVIVSSSGAEVVEPIGQMLGANHIVATRMVIEDGRYTGEISYYAYGPDEGGGDPRDGRERTGTTSLPVTPTATRRPTCRCSRRSAIPSQ